MPIRLEVSSVSSLRFSSEDGGWGQIGTGNYRAFWVSVFTVFTVFTKEILRVYGLCFIRDRSGRIQNALPIALYIPPNCEDSEDTGVKLPKTQVKVRHHPREDTLTLSEDSEDTFRGRECPCAQ